MTPKRFLYFLLKPDGRSGKVVNGVVSYTGVPTPLPQTPSGWQELLIGYERSIEQHGMTRNFSLPLGFVRNGATIIRDAVYNQSTEEPLQLLILRRTLQYNPPTFNWFYEYFYRGELDLTTVEDGQDMLQVSIMEGGLSKLIKDKWNTEYEFAFDNESILIEMDGITLLGAGSFVVVDGIEISNGIYQSLIVALVLIGQEGQAPGLVFTSELLQNTSSLSYADKLTQNNYCAVNNDTTDTLSLRIVGKINLTCTHNVSSNSLKVRFLRSNLLIANQNDYVVIDTFVPTEGSAYSFDVDITIPLQPGERLYLDATLSTIGVDTLKFVFNQDSDLKFTFENRFKTTYIQAFTRDVIYRKLIGKITGDEANAVSQLCTDNQNLCISCFDAVRGFPTATLKITLRDFFKDTDATLCAGIGIENNTVVLEARSHFYDTSNPVDLGIVKDLVHKPAKDIMTSGFQFGHVKPNIEDVNGKYDPNGSIVFTGPLSRSAGKVYDMISPFKAGPYEIELTRVNLEGKTTTDTRNENEVCVINADGSRTAEYEITVSFLAAFTMIIFPNSFNLAPNQRIRIQGSASNDGVYTVTSVGTLLVSQFAIVDMAVVDEANVLVTVTILTAPIYQLRRVIYDTLEGVPYSNIFNIEQLTPKRMAMQHYGWIRGMNHGQDSEKIIYRSGDKNTLLRTVVGGVEIKENDDILIGGMGAKMMQPFYDTFKTEVPVSLCSTLELSPNKCFQYTDENGNVFVGFMFGAGFAPNTLQDQEFRLLASPDNDLTLLVD